MLPDWIDSDSWLGFKEMRRLIRKPLTPRAEVLILRKLVKLKNNGHDPNLALDESTEHNWQSVFPPKTFDVPDINIRTTYAQDLSMSAEEWARADDARKLAMSAIKLVRTI
jgi:hypothetical protein